MNSHSKSIIGFYAKSAPNLSEFFSGEKSDDNSVPAVTDSDVSSEEYDEHEVASIDSSSSSLPSLTADEPTTKKLNWEFHGLTLWLELEEYDSDISNAIEDFAHKYKTESIPKPHMTAIYGMTHLTVNEAKEKLHSIKDLIPSWPKFTRPTGVVSDIAKAGLPGQVCTIAWCELTLSSNQEHEQTLDRLYSHFYDDKRSSWNRAKPWKPHNSLAYDNPEDTMFNLGDMVQYVAQHPSLVTLERRVEAISLWDTNGKMENWKCLDRVYF